MGGGWMSGAKAGKGKESQFCMGKLESKIFLYLFAVVNRDALTQPQRRRGTEDDGHWRGTWGEDD